MRLGRPVTQLLLLVVVAAAANYARLALGPLQEAVRTSLALGDNRMAFLQGPAMALPLMLAALPLGLAIDRYARVQLVRLLCVTLLAGSALSATATSFWILLAARAMVGLSALAINLTLLPLLADWFAAAERGRATMAIGIGQAAGSAFVFGLGGYLLGSGDSWQAVMAWLAVPLVFVSLATVALREPPRREVKLEGMNLLRVPIETSFAEAWRFRSRIGPLLAGIVLAEVALGAAQIWTAPSLARHFGIAPSRVGGILASGLLVSGIAGPMIGGLFADSCQRRGGSRDAMRGLAALAFLAAGAASFAILPTLMAASLVFALFVTLITAACVMATTLFVVVVPNEIRGLCVGLLSASTVIAAVGLGPPAVSLISSAFGDPQRIGTAMSFLIVAASLGAGVCFMLGALTMPRAAAASATMRI